MRNGCIVDVFTSIDIQEIVKIGGNLIKILHGVIYGENFKITPSRKVIKKLFAFSQNYKVEGKVLMQNLVKLILNNVYGVQIRENIADFFEHKFQNWMGKDFDDIVLDYWRLPNGIYRTKLKHEDGFYNRNIVENTLSSQLKAFILPNSKRTMNNFIREKNGFYNNSI